MRTKITWLVVVASWAASSTLGAGGAQAQRAKVKKTRAPASGDYEVKFEQIANNCTDTGMSLSKGTFTLSEKKGGKLEISFPMTAVMFGRISDDGKFQAKADLGGTGIQGVQGKFSIAGRVDDGLIQLVFIAEYYGSGKKPRPLCTQSWNASGLRSDKMK